MTQADDRAARKPLINELVREGLGDDTAGTQIAFFCECGDEQCYEAVWLSAAEYDAGRRDPAWVPLAPGHAVGAASPD